MTGDDVSDAHRSAVACAFIGVVGTIILTVGFWNISGPRLRVAQGIGLIVNAGALLLLRVPRLQRSTAASNAIFLLVLVPTVAMVWLADEARAAHSARWVPYEPNKLSALTLAMIAPPGWLVGIAGIVMFVGSALIHHLTLADGLRQRMTVGEPIGILAYGVFALILLGFRQRSRGLRAKLERARSEKVYLERVARLAMSLRDLANTPVQTLELVRRALLMDDPPLHVLTARMDRALHRLRRLNEVLLPHQTAVTWDDARRTPERPSGAKLAEQAGRGAAQNDQRDAAQREQRAGEEAGAQPVAEDKRTSSDSEHRRQL